MSTTTHHHHDTDKAIPRMSPTSDEARSILIVDDHPAFRWVLRQLAETRLTLEICGEAEDCATGLRLIKELKPTLCTVDLSLSDGSGLELIKQGKQESPATEFIVCTMHTEPHYAERSLSAGAIGYVCKNEGIDQIVEGIRHAMSGELAVSGDLAQRLLQSMTSGRHFGEFGTEKLSDRELEVFELLGEGLTRKAIAERLGRSVKTVESYCERIKDKLGIETSSELTSRAAKWTLTHV